MRKIIVLIFYFVITICLCSCKFNGYYKVEIPTNSPLKGTIKIPNECEFVTEDGIVKLINKNTKEILAEQISQGYFEVLYEKDEKNI